MFNSSVPLSFCCVTLHVWHGPIGRFLVSFFSSLCWLFYLTLDHWRLLRSEYSPLLLCSDNGHQHSNLFYIHPVLEMSVFNY